MCFDGKHTLRTQTGMPEDLHDTLGSGHYMGNLTERGTETGTERGTEREYANNATERDLANARKHDKTGRNYKTEARDRDVSHLDVSQDSDLDSLLDSPARSLRSHYTDHSMSQHYTDHVMSEYSNNSAVTWPDNPIASNRRAVAIPQLRLMSLSLYLSLWRALSRWRRDAAHAYST
jgi:hypothetical protein